VGVLSATVHEDHLGLAVTPGEAAELAKSVHDDVKTAHRRYRNVEVPFLEVFVKK